jgi:hypothetical protein
MATRCSSLLLSVFAGAASLTAQCANAWVPFGAIPGVDDMVFAVADWDPDGPGPAAPRVAVGGMFTAAGSAAATGTAAWEPQTATWSALGAGTPGQPMVRVLLALPNGDLIAGGATVNTTARPLIRWNGATWTSVGGLSGPAIVNTLALLPNGDLAVGGTFTAAGSSPLPYLGIWNGTAWTSPAGGMDGPVQHLLAMPNGDLVAFGSFSVAGGVACNGAARWNGTAWSALGSGVVGANCAVALPNGDLLVGGTFAQAGGAAAACLARWDGSAWSEFAGGIGGSGFAGIGVRGLALLPNGDLCAGGFFMTAGGAAIPNLARWDGSSWSPFGAGIPTGLVNSLVVRPSGELVVGGTFGVAGGIAASRVARWDGTTWSSLGVGEAPNDDVRALLPMPDGSVLAGGAFRTAGGTIANGIARWDGAGWSPLGTGFLPHGRVHAMARRANGGLIAGGSGIVGTWDGTSWTMLPTNLAAAVPHADLIEAVAELPNGDVVIAGEFVQTGPPWLLGLARWNGSSWAPIGGQTAGEVHALATLANGDLVIGGYLWAMSPPVRGIARWNGTTWSPLGSGLQMGGGDGEVFAIVSLPSGGLLVGGAFNTAGGQPANHIARWDGTAWSPLGGGTNEAVRALHVLPNGDVLAAGDFSLAGGVPANRIARWNGTAWSALGSGVQGSFPRITAIAALPNGDLLLGGSMSGAGGLPSPNLVGLTTTCPASVQSAGAGCAGLSVTASLPWTGSVWRADASGLPNAALVAAVHGFAPTSLPLAAVFATALPGCTLHANPETVDLILGTNGTAVFQFVLPNAPALAGIGFRHQMVSIALDATLAVAATNALSLTVGSF